MILYNIIQNLVEGSLRFEDLEFGCLDVDRRPSGREACV